MDRLSTDDIDTIFELARRLAGTVTRPNEHNVIVHNVLRRMELTSCATLRLYLDYVNGAEDELPALISALTIHTPSGFREPRLFVEFDRMLAARPERLTN